MPGPRSSTHEAESSSMWNTEQGAGRRSREEPQLPLQTKLGYGVGQSAEGLTNGAFGTFLLFYYNQVLGISGTLAGLALGIALIVDAVSDPLMGSISDNWRSKRGRRHPFMYAAPIPLALSFFLLFAPPALGELGLFVWLTVFAVATRTALTLFQVPHAALGAELTRDFVQRTSVVAFRQFFSTFGGLAAFIIGFGIFFTATADQPQGQFKVSAYAPYALTLAILMGLAMFVSAHSTRSQIPRLHTPPIRSAMFGVFRRTLSESHEAFGNRSFCWLIVGVLIAFLMVGVDGALNLYMNTFFWELQSSELLIFFIATPIGLLLGYLFTARLHLWFDKRPALVWGTAFWAGGQIFPVMLRLIGWFPENGSSELIATLVAIKFAQGLGMAQAAVSFSSMIADIADEQELVIGKRQEGIFFAAVSFANKATTGLGSIIAGIALDVIDWPRGREVAGVGDVPAETIMHLGVVYGPVVAGFGLFALYCYGRYSLTKVKHREIQRQLELRRLATADGGFAMSSEPD